MKSLRKLVLNVGKSYFSYSDLNLESTLFDDNHLALLEKHVKNLKSIKELDLLAGKPDFGTSNF